MTGGEILVAMMLMLGTIGNALDERGAGIAAACEGLGGVYAPHEELLEATDIQYWACTEVDAGPLRRGFYDGG